MSAWLTQILKMILGSIIPKIIQDLLEKWQKSQEMKAWKEAESAKLDEAAKDYVQELKDAGDDIKKQEAAADKLFDSTK